MVYTGNGHGGLPPMDNHYARPRARVRAYALSPPNSNPSKGGNSFFFIVILVMCLSLLAAGCAPGKYIYDVKPNGEMSYYYIDQDWSSARERVARDHERRKRTRSHEHRHTPATVIVVEPEKQADDSIPREYAKFVSSRGPTTWRARGRMCREARPGYCNYPNVPHCHGPYCHAHPGGDKKHTH